VLFSRSRPPRLEAFCEIIEDWSMKQTNVLPYLSILFLVGMSVLLPATAPAQTWQWQTSLRVNKTGDAMYMPSAIGFDQENERYYVTDTGRNRLVSFGKDGKMLKAFTANDQLKSPFDMVRVNNDQLWVVEKGRNSLTLIDIGARKITPHTLSDRGHQVFPDRIALSGGKLYVLDRASGQVLRLGKDLSVEQRYGCPDCSAGMADFVIDGDSILALEPWDKKIYRFQVDGKTAGEIKLGGDLDFPVSLAVGPSGFIYVLDRHQDCVMVYSPDGHFRYRFLGPGQAANEVYFPRQLRFDPWGRLCVVDEGNGRVEIYGR
jgi:DNA-binding beta-propeller fold protein YncE